MRRGQHSDGIELSIVIPIYDEHQSLPILWHELDSVLTQLHKTYEVIFIDDGSTDGSGELLSRLCAEDGSHLRLVSFARNLGQTAALSAGFQRSRGDIIVALDADLQNDPRDIPRLLDKLEEGYDLVGGWRKDRKDALLSRRIPSFVFNLLTALLTSTRFHDLSCTLKAYRGSLTRQLRLELNWHRFIPAVACHLGARCTEIPVNHRPRRFGNSKYAGFRAGMERYVNVVASLLSLRSRLNGCGKTDPNNYHLTLESQHAGKDRA